MSRTPFVLAAVTTVGLTALLGNSPQARAQQPGDPPAAAQTETVANPDLRRELLARMERDQAARQQLIQAMRDHPHGQPPQPGPDDDPRLRALRRVDRENREWLQGIIEKSGWPGASQVGTDGAHAAWLLVQHADEAPDFQRRCLELLRKAAPGEVAQTDLAYLTDRVMIKDTGTQLYGTQVRRREDGTWEPLPLAEPDRVEKLRREAGMPPLAEYLDLVAKTYDAAPRAAPPPTGADKPK